MYAIWNNSIRIFLVVFSFGSVAVIANIVSNNHLIMARYLTSVEQYYYTTLHILALPSPLVGCGASIKMTKAGAASCVMLFFL